MEKDELLTAQELAEYLKLDEMTVYNWATAGIIPAHRLLKHWRFRKTEIDKWLNLVWFPSLTAVPRTPRKLNLYDPDANRIIARAVSDHEMGRLAKALRGFLGETTALNQLIARLATQGWGLHRVLEKINIDETWVTEKLKELFVDVGSLEAESQKGKERNAVEQEQE